MKTAEPFTLLKFTPKPIPPAPTGAIYEKLQRSIDEYPIAAKEVEHLLDRLLVMFGKHGSR